MSCADPASFLETDADEFDGLALVRTILSGPLHGRIALVSSFGAESAVLLDMVATVDRSVPVIFLDTGMLFGETLDYRHELCRYFGLTDVRSVQPDVADIDRHDPDGDLSGRDPDFCCHLRKTEPLDLALDGFCGWITGRKRFQGGRRADLPNIEHDPATDLIKINPLAHWSLEDIRHYRRLRQLPLHPLVTKGFTSIGCAPCTSPAGDGDDGRAGRWPGIEKQECGIHR